MKISEEDELRYMPTKQVDELFRRIHTDLSILESELRRTGHEELFYEVEVCSRDIGNLYGEWISNNKEIK